MKITMAHGSGGDASRELVRGLFHKYLGNEFLEAMEDGAALPAEQLPPVLTTDSFVVHPLFFPGGDIGKLAVCGTVNDLWMSGAQPRYLTAGFILVEGLDIDLLERIAASMALAVRESGVKIVAGDTKVVEGRGGLYINTAGVGYRSFQTRPAAVNIKPGDAVLLSGPLGNHHACILSRRLEIENRIESDCADLGQLVKPLLQEGLALRAMRDITRGGLATVLNEMAEAAGVSVLVEEKALPVDDDVRDFCGILGLDPLYMANEGKFLCFIAPEDEEKALAIMHRCPLGRQAAVIGRVQSLAEAGGPPVLLRTALGGKRLLDILYGEGLPRIC